MKLLSKVKYHKELVVNLRSEHRFSLMLDGDDVALVFKEMCVDILRDVFLSQSIIDKIKLTHEYSNLPFGKARDKYAEILGDDRLVVSKLLRKNSNFISSLDEKIAFCLNSKINGSVLVDYESYLIINGVFYRVYPDLNISLVPDLSFNLTDAFFESMSSYLVDDNKKTLLAFGVLQNSRHQQSLRQRWIEITVAAELGIKEFFVRRFPDFEKLINEMPSPNIRKMYGPLLEHYTGVKAPNLSAIQNGIEVRNALVHSLSEQDITAISLDVYTKKIKECLIFLQENLTGRDVLTENHIIFGELVKVGGYSVQINLTNEQEKLVSQGVCIGTFKTIVFE